MIVTDAIFGSNRIGQTAGPISKVNGTSNSLRLIWPFKTDYSHHSIKRDGVEVYKGVDLEFIDFMLEPDTTYTYQIYGHTEENAVGVVNPDIFSFTTENIHSSIYAETTAYMNAIGVVNDATTYYSGTAQEVTGSEMYISFNEIVHFLKINNVWDKFLYWNPIWGDTWAKRSVNAHNPLNYDIEFFNQANWVVYPYGIKGNGTNTYGKFKVSGGSTYLNLKDIPFNYSRGIGVSVTANPNSNLEVELGEVRTVQTAFFVGSNISDYGGMLIGLGSPYSGEPVASALGVSYGYVHLDRQYLYKNGFFLRDFITDVNEAGSLSKDVTIGCLMEIGNKVYFSSKTISSAFATIGIDNVTSGSAVSIGIEMWETYIKRKNW